MVSGVSSRCSAPPRDAHYWANLATGDRSAGLRTSPVGHRITAATSSSVVACPARSVPLLDERTTVAQRCARANMAQAKTNHITVMVRPAHSSEAATATRNPPAAMMLGFVGVSDRPRGGPQAGSTVGRFADSGGVGFVAFGEQHTDHRHDGLGPAGLDRRRSCSSTDPTHLPHGPPRCPARSVVAAASNPEQSVSEASGK